MTMAEEKRADSTDCVTQARKVVIVGSLARSLTNFRLCLIKDMVQAGHEVVAVAPDRDEDVARILAELNVRFEQVPMARTGLNPLTDARTLFSLWRLLRRERPDVILPYTIKPVIYTCLAGRWAAVPHRFALVTGLGYLFTGTPPSVLIALVRRMSLFLFRLALKGAEAVFVYNKVDARQLRDADAVRPADRITLIPGTGVDMTRFARTPVPRGPATFLLIARLLRDKGVFEFAEAAKKIRSAHPDARFQLLGPFDPNPSAISPKDVERWVAEGTLDYLGSTNDVRPFLSQCTVFVLPSYREGLPRTVLEAMSVGRAVITTDAPGCNETITDGESGFVVPVKDAGSLAQAMQRFIDEPELAVRMGEAAHRLACDRFEVSRINSQLLTAMGLVPR